MVAAFLQVMAPSYENVTLGVNSVLGYILIVSLVLTPFIVLIFMIKLGSIVMTPTDNFKK